MKDLLTDTYKTSVVQVIARDDAGNELNQAMGVSIGVNENNTKLGERFYIATPLSLILGNSLQWADKIEIVQENGVSLDAKVVLIDEQIDLVLLAPEASPRPIRFVPLVNERAQLSVITISLEKVKQLDGTSRIEAEGHEAILSAVSSDEGTLAVSGRSITNKQAGTAILNMQGQLMGMLLPNAKGVLASALIKAIEQAKEKTPFHPRLVGVIMGRGVLVDPRLREAYGTIEEALKAIATGQAPKADTKRFLRAITNEYRPAEPERPILKVAPGEYKQEAPLVIPSNLSFSGSGAKTTIIRGTDPKASVLEFEDVKNTTVANFRIVPAESQDPIAATVKIRNSENIVLLGNVIQAEGGRGVHAINSKRISLFGNTFPKGDAKAIYCQNSTTTLEANAFVAEWTQALAVGKGCQATVENNLFVRNRISVAVSGQSENLRLVNNSFIGSNAAIRFFGEYPKFVVEDNLFFRNKFSILAQLPIQPKQFGRNGAYKSVAFQDGKMVLGLDFVKGRPEFRKPDKYDFRLLPGSPNVGAGIPEKDGTPTDIGAFQPETFLGKYTSQLISTLSLALESDSLAEEWGYDE